MNIYHITYSPQAQIACFYFWGCNLDCRCCLRKEEVYDHHLGKTLAETPKPGDPRRFLDLEETQQATEKLKIKEAVFMGSEATLDPELPELAEYLHRHFDSHNVILTNGFVIPEMENIDEVVFSLKAYNRKLHHEYTGRDNDAALANFVTYHQSGVKLRAESILIPDYIDYHEIETIAQFIGCNSRDIPYRIDAYIPVGNNPWRLPTQDEMNTAVAVAQKHVTEVSCLTGKQRLKYNVVRVV